MEKEVLIEIRNNDKDLSIQSFGIGNDDTGVRKILKEALEALDKPEGEKDKYGNEIVVKR